jgi:hypothetical protein
MPDGAGLHRRYLFHVVFVELSVQRRMLRRDDLSAGHERHPLRHIRRRVRLLHIGQPNLSADWNVRLQRRERLPLEAGVPGRHLFDVL